MWLTVSVVTVYAGFYLFIVFLSLCIACGLYWLAELIEEYTVTTRKMLGHVIKAELALHALLLLDGLPVTCLVTGAAAHLAYARLMRRFPYISLTSPEGLASLAGFVASNALWMRQHWRNHYTVEYIAAFLIATSWLVPFALFLSMAGENAVLPGAGGYPYSPQASSGSGGLARNGSFGGGLGGGSFGGGSFGGGGRGGGGGGSNSSGKKRRGLALRLFDMARRKRDEALPGVLAALPDSTHLLKEKI